MPEPDDVLNRVEQAAELAKATQETIQQTSEGNVPAGPVSQLASAVQQVPQVREAAQQLQSAVQQVQQVGQVGQQLQGAVQQVGQAGQQLQGVVQQVQQVMDVAEQILGRGVETVHFTFESGADPNADWRVVELHSREGLSELYSCTLDLATEQLETDVNALLGSSAQVVIARGGATRRLCGIVHRVEHTGFKGRFMMARVHVAPALQALSQRRDCFIFQEKTVPQILEEVLSEGLQPFDRSYRPELSREYLPREYCVQYRESDLDFVLRLMEEEGIFFYFDHSREKEELVLLEQNDQCQACETANGPVPLRNPQEDSAPDESLRQFDSYQQMHTTSVVVRDFNWTHPDYDLTHEARAEDALGRDHEAYEYPAPLLGPYDAGAKRYGYEPAQRQEELRRQAFHVEGKGGKGSGYVLGFTAGYKFELAGHKQPALDQWYLLTRVEHHGYAPEAIVGDAVEPRPGLDQEHYRNTFDVIPLDVPFRPERRRGRARMAGLQTATVVGPSGEEVHTDEHGRIKVQFHWDRAGKRNEHSSCFLRVAQLWAGLGWGFMFLPRIGMEVLVDFLEGDPDRPLVVGCVYNGRNTPPYALPANKTRSTIRTSSSKQSDGFNELRFEDAAGSEEIFLHAQKDLKEVVLNDHSTEVTGSQENKVVHAQKETVGGDQTMTVHGQRSKEVDKDETIKVHGKRTETVDKDETIIITGKRTEEVTGLEKLTLHGGRDVTVNTKEKLLVTGSRREDIRGNDRLIVTENRSTRVAKQYLMTGGQMLKTEQGDVSITLAESITLEGKGHKVALHNDSGQMVFDGNKIEVSAKEELSLSCGNASIKLKKDGTVEISGSKEVGLGVQQTTVKLEAAGATISAPTLTSSAQGTHEITGALIKIN